MCGRYYNDDIDDRMTIISRGGSYTQQSNDEGMCPKSLASNSASSITVAEAASSETTGVERIGA